MSGPLDHKARIVAELQNRLGEATTDDDQDFLASQLSEAGNDLEGACLIALRNARETEALVEALKSIIADNKARKDRLEAKAEKIRAAVVAAMAEAGLPRLVGPDMTVPLIPTKVLTIEGKPTKDDYLRGWARASFDWSKTNIRKAIEDGEGINFATLSDGYSLRINPK